MKTIGISGLEEQIIERLSKPREYDGRTLVLWNSSFMDWSIEYMVIKQACIKYNLANRDKQVWFRSLSAMDTEDYSNVNVLCDQKEMYGFKNRAIFFDAGCVFKTEVEKWLMFVNKHENSVSRLSSDWLLISCAHEKDFNLKEEMFDDNCDICLLDPTFDEWEEWVTPIFVVDEVSKKIQELVFAYIKEKGKIVSYSYWQRIMFALYRKIKFHSDDPNKTISERGIYLTVGGLVSFTNFPTEDFCRFFAEKF